MPAPSAKEATARIKINKLLEAAGWRFFADTSGPANIQLEPGVKLTSAEVDALGENFEKTTKGFIDFLLLDERGFPRPNSVQAARKMTPIRKLITRFEQKIQAILARVSGGKPVAAP